MDAIRHQAPGRGTGWLLSAAIATALVILILQWGLHPSSTSLDVPTARPSPAPTFCIGSGWAGPCS
jgi:hypothetical protein